MLIATLVAPIRVVGNLASLFSLLGFAVVNLAVIRLRRQRPNLARPFEVPFYPAAPLLGIVLNLLLGLFISPETWAIAIGWLGIGVVFYVALHRPSIPFGRGEPAVDDGPTSAAGGSASGADGDADAPVVVDTPTTADPDPWGEREGASPADGDAREVEVDPDATDTEEER